MSDYRPEDVVTTWTVKFEKPLTFYGLTHLRQYPEAKGLVSEIILPDGVLGEEISLHNLGEILKERIWVDVMEVTRSGVYADPEEAGPESDDVPELRVCLGLEP